MALLAMSRLAAMRRLPLVTSPAWRGLADSAPKPAEAAAAAEAAGKTADSTAEPESGTSQETAAEPDVEAAPDTGAEPGAGAVPGGGAEPDVEAAPDTGAEPGTGAVQGGGAEPDVEAAPDTGAEPGTGAVQEGGAEPDVKAAPDSGAKPDDRKAKTPRRWQDSRYQRRGTWSAEPGTKNIRERFPVTSPEFSEAIHNLAKEGDYTAAKRMYDDMVALGYVPTPKTYGPLLRLAANRGKAQDMRSITRMNKEMGFFAGIQDHYRFLNCYRFSNDPASALMTYEHIKAQFLPVDAEIMSSLLEAIQDDPLSARRAKDIVADFEAEGKTLKRRGVAAAIRCAVRANDVKFGRHILERYDEETAQWQYIELVCRVGDSDDFKQMQEKIGQWAEKDALRKLEQENLHNLHFAIYHARQGDAAKAVDLIKNHLSVRVAQSQTSQAIRLEHYNNFLMYLSRCKDCKDKMLEYLEAASSKGYKLRPRSLEIVLSVMIDAGDVPRAKEFAEMARRRFPNPPEGLGQVLDTKYKYFIMRTTDADEGEQEETDPVHGGLRADPSAIPAEGCPARNEGAQMVRCAH